MKHTGWLTAAIVLVLAWPTAAVACHITFEPDQVQVGQDGKGTVTVWIKWEHRRCELDDQDVNVDVKNLQILKKGSWERVRRGLFRNDFEVQLTGENGSIRIWRECTKKGISEHTVQVIRASATPPSNTPSR